ncbi:MAG TPA: c-type cytochrome [Gammaproteobacteria bacterium]
MVHRWLISIMSIGCIGVLSANAQQANPYEGDAAAIRAGGALYARRCAACHGADAKGTPGPDLTQLGTSGANSKRVFDVVQRGIEGSIMPPSLAADNEIWAIVAYLRSVGTVPPFANDRGDAARGRRIFASVCARCHRVQEQGGAMGPDLSRIAMVRSREALVQAIRDPSASIERGYRAVTLVTKNGERIQGVAKNEDAFSIQIMNADAELKGYSKVDLEQVIHESQSPMPAHGSSDLRRRELDDLLAYLGTLRATDDAER